MNNAKSFFQILCLLVLGVTIVAGCSKKPDKETPAPEPQQVAEPTETQEVAVKETEEVDIWTQDFAAAKKQASEQGKDLLIDFTGSDWCGWCIKLDNEVFSKQAFIDEAPKHFVLVKLDYPRDQTLITEEVRQQNEKLKEQYPIQGFPTIFLTDASGTPYAQTGYQSGGPESYNEHLAKLQAQNVELNEILNKIKNDTVTGVEKAKLLDQVIDIVPPALAEKFFDIDVEEYVNQIIELDANNEAGLKTKYQMSRRMNEVQNAKRTGDWNKAVELTDAIITELKPTGEELQKLYFGKSESLFRQENNDAAKKTLETAIAIDPDSETAAEMKDILARVFPEQEVEAIAEAAETEVAEEITEEAAKPKTEETTEEAK